MSDVERLEREVDDVRLQASDPVFGAVELLNEVSATKITGEEERYSHTDFYDIAANVEGAEVAFEFVKPVVKRQNPDLVAEIETRFADLEREMEPYRRDAGWVSYEKVDEGERRVLSQKVDAPAEPLSRVESSPMSFPRKRDPGGRTKPVRKEALYSEPVSLRKYAGSAVAIDSQSRSTVVRSLTGSAISSGTSPECPSG
jgi:Imelysin